MAAVLYKLLQRSVIFIYMLFLGYLIYVNPRLMARLFSTGKDQVDAVFGWFLICLCGPLTLFRLLQPVNQDSMFLDSAQLVDSCDHGNAILSMNMKVVTRIVD